MFDYYRIFIMVVFVALFNPRVVFAHECMSINVSKLSMRVGPGKSYPVKFLYEMKHLPMHVISKFEDWVQVCDVDGDCGWALSRMLSKQKYVIALDDLVGRKDPFFESKIVAKIGANVLLNLRSCDDEWCLVFISKKNFWVSRSMIWGCN